MQILVTIGSGFLGIARVEFPTFILASVVVLKTLCARVRRVGDDDDDDDDDDHDDDTGIPYEITTYTSDKRGAGTDADVYVCLYGRDMCTSLKSICPNKKDQKKLFSRGNVTTLRVKVLTDVLASDI